MPGRLSVPQGRAAELPGRTCILNCASRASPEILLTGWDYRHEAEGYPEARKGGLS